MASRRQPPLSLSGQAGTAGTVTLTVRSRGVQTWLISQIGIEMTRGDTADVSAAATGMIRRNGFPVTPFIAQADAPSGDPYVQIEPGDELTINWAACNSGDVCSALVFFEVE